MIHIITTTQVQQKIGQISDSIGEKSYIVTNRGQGRMILLPYYDGCNEFIDDYMEDFEMMKNKEKLQRSYQESHDSGPSSLVI
jgi:hypothetical protein